MTSTRTRDTYIGRVGALAVALGIGSTILAMPGVAWAEPDSTSATSQTASGASGGTFAEKPKGPRVLKKRPPKDAPSAATAEAQGATDTPSTTGASKKKRLTTASTPTRTRASKDGGLSSEATSMRPGRPPAESTDAGGDQEKVPDDVTTRTAVAQGKTQGPAGVAPTTDDAAEPVRAAEQLRPLATALTTLFSPRALTPAPDAPEPPAASSTLLWTMLSSVRRQTGDRTAAASTVVASGAPSRSVQAAGVASLPGEAYESPVVAPDGTIYQVTHNANGATISILDRDAQVIATTGQIDGFVRGGAVTRPDGTLIVVTSKQRGTRSTISSIDSDGTVTTLASVSGVPDLRVRTGADGSVYFSTRTPRPFDPFGRSLPNRYYRISPTNSVRALPYNTSLALTPDGSAYLVSRQGGISTLRVYTSTGDRTIALPFGSTVSDAIVGQDGTAYVTAGQRGLFGTKTTRVYTLTGAVSTTSTLTGLPGATVVTADGLYLETFTYPGNTDPGTGTTYISMINGDGTQTSDPIAGRLAGFTFQVTQDGTVYAPLLDPSSADGRVAVVSPEGAVATVTVPGQIVTRTVRTDNAATTGSQNLGYVNYRAGGVNHVAVLDADGTITRTIDLPAGATASTVFFGPDGAAYELLDYFGPDAGQTTARQLIALDTGTLTQVVPGTTAPGSFDVVFGPNGVGYFLSSTANSAVAKIVGFDSAGTTVVPLSTFTDPVSALTNDEDFPDIQYLSFAPDGTAYVLDYATGPTAGVYALTSSGAQLVQAIDRAGGTRATAPTFTPDGTTGFVTIASDGGDTLVLSFSTVTTL